MVSRWVMNMPTNCIQNIVLKPVDTKYFEVVKILGYVQLIYLTKSM